MEELESVLQSIISDKNVEEESKEALEIMVEMAKEKAVSGDQKIQNDLREGKTPDNITVPVSSVIQCKTEYLALTSESSEDTMKDINLFMRNMISDNSGIINGLSEIAYAAINDVTRLGEGQQTECRFCNVVMDYPMIIRLDYYLWGYNIKSKSLMSHLKSVLACVRYKSVVEVSKLDHNTFLSLYSPVLEKAFIDEPDKCKEMINKSKELYSLYL